MRVMWSGPPNGDTVRERLDRFLVTPDLINEWPSLAVQHLLKVDASDHLPILLSLDRPTRRTKALFRLATLQ